MHRETKKKLALTFLSVCTLMLSTIVLAVIHDCKHPLTLDDFPKDERVYRSTVTEV
jgi:hypothetical protein